MHDQLRDALRRVDPPAGFADRVIRNVENVRVENVRLKADATKVRWGWAVAATLVVALGGGGAWYRTEERHRQEETKVNNHEEGR